jgi:hypothetical protein
MPVGGRGLQPRSGSAPGQPPSSHCGVSTAFAEGSDEPLDSSATRGHGNGDPLSPDEEQRINGHWRALTRKGLEAHDLLSPDEREQIPFDERDDALLERIRYLADTTDDPAELRKLIHILAGLHEHWLAFYARQEGQFWRRQRARHRGGRTSGAARRESAAEFLRDIEDLKARGPHRRRRGASASPRSRRMEDGDRLRTQGLGGVVPPSPAADQKKSRTRTQLGSAPF